MDDLPPLAVAAARLYGLAGWLDDELAGGAPPKYLVQVAADAARWIADTYRQEISERN